jgi:hypothetical protein
MIIEAKKLIFVLSISSKLLLEKIDVSSAYNIPRTAVEAMTILWHELINENIVFFIDDSVVVIDSFTIIAYMLGLFDSDLHFLWQAQVDECVHTTTILLEQFSLGHNSWEINEDEPISALICNSKKLQCKLILNLLIDITSIKHILGLQEEGV